MKLLNTVKTKALELMAKLKLTKENAIALGSNGNMLAMILGCLGCLFCVSVCLTTAASLLAFIFQWLEMTLWVCIYGALVLIGGAGVWFLGLVAWHGFRSWQSKRSVPAAPPAA